MRRVGEEAGEPLEPLFEAVERHRLNVTHLLTTHADHDHIAGDAEILARYDCPVVKALACDADHRGRAGFAGAAVSRDLETGGLEFEAIPTPGHSDDMVAFVVGDAVFSGDTLFKDAVGGGDFAAIRHVVMDVYMAMPHGRRVLPGHTDETTIGREWEHNPFVRVWRGEEPEGTEPCRVGGREATLVVWSPDYDGKGKAWVRFDDGRDAIVGGSRVER